VTTERESDQLLVERVQAGDQKAFDLLVSKYQRRLMRLVSRLVHDPAEAEDVVQETFIKAYRALRHFRGDSAFYTWLYRIGINTAKNYLVTQGRRAPTFISTTMSWLSISARRVATSSGQGRIRVRSLPTPSGHSSAAAAAA